MEARSTNQAFTAADSGFVYQRHQPQQRLLYQLIERHYADFLAQLASAGRTLPRYVEREFEDYLRCGRLEYGLLRVRCTECHAEKRVAFSCKRRGFCPSCGARRRVESAALLVDEVLPRVPLRQWLLSVPFALRLLFARQPAHIQHGEADFLGLLFPEKFAEFPHALLAAVRAAEPDRAMLFQIADHDAVVVSLAHGDLVDPDNGRTRFARTFELLAPVLLVQLLDRMPAQVQLLRHILDRAARAALTDIAGKSR